MLIETYSRAGSLNDRKPVRFWVRVLRWLNADIVAGHRRCSW